MSGVTIVQVSIEFCVCLGKMVQKSQKKVVFFLLMKSSHIC